MKWGQNWGVTVPNILDSSLWTWGISTPAILEMGYFLKECEGDIFPMKEIVDKEIRL